MNEWLTDWMYEWVNEWVVDKWYNSNKDKCVILWENDCNSTVVEYGSGSNVVYIHMYIQGI